MIYSRTPASQLFDPRDAEFASSGAATAVVLYQRRSRFRPLFPSPEVRRTARGVRSDTLPGASHGGLPVASGAPAPEIDFVCTESLAPPGCNLKIAVARLQ